MTSKNCLRLQSSVKYSPLLSIPLDSALYSVLQLLEFDGTQVPHSTEGRHYSQSVSMEFQGACLNDDSIPLRAFEPLSE